MRLRELRQRASYEETLRQTLARGWTSQLGRRVTVDATDRANRAAWFEATLLSALHSRNPSRRARRFMADLYRFTPRRLRSPLQAAAVTAASSRVGLRLLSRPRFSLSEPIPHADSMVVIPGNERVRVFDLRREEVLVLLNAGFDRSRLAAEVALRRGTEGPWAPIREADADSSWFVEPYLPGYALPRCPPWYPRRALLGRGIERLRAWQEHNPVEVGTSDHVAHLHNMIDRLPEEVRAPGLRLLDELGSSPSLAVVHSHGDLQAGNFYVDRASHNTWIFDWEYAGPRFCSYDALVFELGSRFPSGLASRAHEFLEHGFRTPAGTLVGTSSERGERRLMLCGFLVEELVWHAKRSASIADPARASFHHELRLAAQART